MSLFSCYCARRMDLFILKLTGGLRRCAALFPGEIPPARKATCERRQTPWLSGFGDNRTVRFYAGEHGICGSVGRSCSEIGAIGSNQPLCELGKRAIEGEGHAPPGTCACEFQPRC